MGLKARIAMPVGKPAVGVHWAVESNSLSKLDYFAPTNGWVGGALRCDLGTLARGAVTNIEFLMSLQTVTVAGVAVSRSAQRPWS